MQIKTALALSAAMLLGNGVAAQQTPSTNTQSGSQTNQSGQTNSGQSGNTTGNQADQTAPGQSSGTSTTQSGSSAAGQSGQSGQSTQPDQSAGQSGSTPSGQSTSGSTSGQTGSQTGTQSSGAAATGSSSSNSAAAAGGAVSAQDRDFVHQAAMGGMAEVDMAKLALQKASSDAVKQYAQKMIDDHTKANDQLKSIASAKGITIPDGSPMMSAGASGSTSQTSSSSGSAASGQGAAMSANMGSKDTAKMHEKHMAAMSKLQGLSGTEFDREYINQAGNKDHEQQAKLFERQASRGTDPELKSFAATTLPIVQAHLSAARDLSKNLKGGSASPSGTTTNPSGGASGSTTKQ